MKSDLLNPRTIEMDILIWCGQLKQISFDEYHAMQMLSNSAIKIKNALDENMPIFEKFSNCFEGIYSLCIGCLYLYGVTPLGKIGQKEMVVQLACELLELDLDDRDTLMLVSRHSEAIFENGSDLIGTPQVDDILVLAEVLMSSAQKRFPSWFG